MASQQHKSTCPYCGYGCALDVTVEDGCITKIGGHKGYSVNNGDICKIAANLPPVFSSEDRLTKPLIRKDGKLTETSWDSAISTVASKFKETIEEYGPDSVAFFGGAANLTEEYYLMNKLMRAGIGTNNIECSTRLCMASTAAGFLSTLGADSPPTCYADLEEADLFFIAGSNMAVSSPVLFRRLSRAKKKNDAKVIVVDPRQSETTEIADIHLQIRPGTDVALNNTLGHVLFRDGFVDEKEVEYYASGLAALKSALEASTPKIGSEITGCSEEQIVKAAHLIGSSEAMLTFWFQGYNHSTQAVFKNNSLHNISLISGNFCHPGAGPFSITGEANALGNRWVGALSHLLPGMRSAVNRTHREEVAKYWGIPTDKMSATPGRSILDMIDGIHSGDIKAIWIMTTNPAASLPNTKWVVDALSKVDLLVVQDIFPNETTKLADIVLPAAQWCEKEGTFISSERRVEHVSKLIEAPGEAKPDYEIVTLVARAMGFESLFPHDEPEKVFEEWKRLTEGKICDMGGVTYDRLKEKEGIQLPCPHPDHPGTERLFTDKRFPRPDGRAALLVRHYQEPDDKLSSEFPMILITGRLSTHFNTRTRTARSKTLNSVEPENFVEIHPEDASRYNLSEGDEVAVTSSRGTVRGKARLTKRVLKGAVYMNSHYGSAIEGHTDRLANLVTNQAKDIHSKQPELKYSAVRISKQIKPGDETA